MMKMHKYRPDFARMKAPGSVPCIAGSEYFRQLVLCLIMFKENKKSSISQKSDIISIRELLPLNYYILQNEKGVLFLPVFNYQTHVTATVNLMMLLAMCSILADVPYSL